MFQRKGSSLLTLGRQAPLGARCILDSLGLSKWSPNVHVHTCSLVQPFRIFQSFRVFLFVPSWGCLHLPVWTRWDNLRAWFTKEEMMLLEDDDIEIGLQAADNSVPARSCKFLKSEGSQS